MKYLFLSIGAVLLSVGFIQFKNSRLLEHKAGQLVVLGVFPDKEQAAIEGVQYDPDLYFKEAILKWNVGGLFFKRRWKKEQLLQKIALAKSLRPENPPRIFLDMEWGLAMRCQDVEPLPKAGILGQQKNMEEIYKWGKTIGQQALEMGVDIILGPVADINTNPNNPVIGLRSFGSDPDDVAQQVAVTVQGMHRPNIYTCLKHFPGHGDTFQDSHLVLPSVKSSLERLRQIELKPFQAGIAAGASCIMTAHIVLPNVTGDSHMPATFSKEILEGLLRNELDFQGVILSDDLFMRAIKENYSPATAAVNAIEAGCDMILATDSIEEMIPAIAQLDEQLLDKKIKRIATTLQISKS